MLAASYGDSILITYGNVNQPKRILIDGGFKKTFNAIKREIVQIPGGERELELIIITHVDNDHILGILELLEQPQLGVKYKDIWFNGYPHLDGSQADVDLESFGVQQGERLSSILVRPDIPWNKAFNGQSISIPSSGIIPEKILTEGMKIRLFSPTNETLINFKDDWEKACKKAGLIPGIAPTRPEPDPDEEVFGEISIAEVNDLAESKFEEDSSGSNGTSIAVLAEYKDKRILLAGDAHASILLSSLETISPGRPLRIDAFKIPHHGSRGSVSKELVQALDCKNYLVSTNGKRFHHPHREAIARILKYGGNDKKIMFNYEVDPETTVWDSSICKQEFSYNVDYPQDTHGYTLKLI